ncbi:polyprenyl synthetase family protein [Leptotrichia sp. OH3620_COT-345]|uniref:polyprenyl synthetase family protein n=1 Tax=Leptotrichia sp. OH3620_COT-345 TaxID=2491048 RepID=UPI000F64AC2E|nr:farnesyl diphosphate synthase [Leptotrichia sp. OH3620_COT-345]RRD40395.1 polyprenyl synthetase family protein [Leptotrichia sp. OH3620_COT-345]
MLKEYLSQKKELIEKELQKNLRKYLHPKTLSEVMYYAVMNGGKRLRPILMYMMCDLFQRSYDNIKDVATALEFIHCYSLVHDDLPAMDNDIYRRGKLTVHTKYDEATAILVGDILLTEAFNIIATSDYINDKNKVNVMSKLSEYAGFFGMAGGQFVDIKSEHIKVSYDTLKYIHENKTGKLITAAIELPLIILNVNQIRKEKLIKYSRLIGTAFQIKDDILDIEGTFEKIGKKPSDEKLEKTTYPSLFGLKKSKEILNEHISEAKKILKDFENNNLLMELTEYIGKREA